LVVFRDSRPIGSYTRVEKAKYLKHFLAVACSVALPRQITVAISVLANSSDKCISFIRISYLATTVNSCIGLQQTKNSLHQSPANMQRWTMQFQYCGTIEYCDTGYLNHFQVSHCTTLCCIIFLFHFRCQAHVYVATSLRHSNDQSPVKSTVYLPIN